jgi:hypothetical protein
MEGTTLEPQWNRRRGARDQRRRGTQWQAVHSGSSFCSASELALTFGLGRDEKSTSVEVQWPGGMLQVLKDVQAGQRSGYQTA